MNQEKITELKTTKSVTITREEYVNLTHEAADAVVIKDDLQAFLLTSMIAIKAMSKLEDLLFGEEN